MSTTQFTPGDQLGCRSLGDYDCIFRFTVVSRTAKFVSLQYFNDIKRVAIRKSHDGIEYCYPLGSHSMAPTLRAGENPQ